MEVKVPGAYPLWLVRALDDCGAYPTSFSKYGEAYLACEGKAAPKAYREQVAFDEAMRGEQERSRDWPQDGQLLELSSSTCAALTLPLRIRWLRSFLISLLAHKSLFIPFLLEEFSHVRPCIYVVVRNG